MSNRETFSSYITETTTVTTIKRVPIKERFASYCDTGRREVVVTIIYIGGHLAYTINEIIDGTMSTKDEGIFKDTEVVLKALASYDYTLLVNRFKRVYDYKHVGITISCSPRVERQLNNLRLKYQILR